MKYIGIDFHKQYFVATVMDGDGKVISKDKVLPILYSYSALIASINPFYAQSFSIPIISSIIILFDADLIFK